VTGDGGKAHRAGTAGAFGDLAELQGATEDGVADLPVGVAQPPTGEGSLNRERGVVDVADGAAGVERGDWWCRRPDDNIVEIRLVLSVDAGSEAERDQRHDDHRVSAALRDRRLPVRVESARRRTSLPVGR